MELNNFYFSKKNVQTKELNDGLIIDEYCAKEKNLPIDGAMARFNGSFGPKVNKKFYELFLVISGKMKIDLEGTKYILEEGDIFILPPDKVHTTYGYAAKVFIACTPQFEAKNVEMMSG